MTLSSPLSVLKGIGPKTEDELKKQGVSSIGELLQCFPSAYRSFSDITDVQNASPGKFSMFRLVIKSKPFFISRSKSRNIFTLIAGDDTGSLRITFFNQQYYSSILKPGSEWIFYGRIRLYKEHYCLDNPKIYSSENASGILPIYPISRVKQKTLRSAVMQALKETVDIADDYSAAFLSKYSLLTRKDELNGIHAPSCADDYMRARKSFMFKDFLLHAAASRQRVSKSAPPLPCHEKSIKEYSSRFPFDFTGAQLRAINEISQDMQSCVPMNRLLQGDVGSGKTAVAFFAAYNAMKNGYQSVMMAPTALLANQHYENAVKIFGSSTALLTSSTPASVRANILKGLKDASISFLIGTHAVLYEHLDFNRLAVVIADEQHRFGVEQRAALAALGEGVHSLIMSATPIPRTLALSVFGHVDVSVLDELPPGRKPVKTFIISENRRSDMYAWIHTQIRMGKQAYVVCPFIESVDELEGASVDDIYIELSSSFKDIRIETLTGKMRPFEKNRVMDSFKKGDTDILVSTTVIEVGVDVKNAGIMVIENAERFGLAALHQLRGRVGRGEDDAFCYLVSDSKSAARLEMLTKTCNGFEIAEYDLKTRGGGLLYGIKQHGELETETAGIMDNPELYHMASDAIIVMENDFPLDHSTVLKLAAEKADRLRRIADN